MWGIDQPKTLMGNCSQIPFRGDYLENHNIILKKTGMGWREIIWGKHLYWSILDKGHLTGVSWRNIFYAKCFKPYLITNWNIGTFQRQILVTFNLKNKIKSGLQRYRITHPPLVSYFRYLIWNSWSTKGLSF